jgi:ABC-type transport system involved in cytochrome c biogenesis permease subunit
MDDPHPTVFASIAKEAVGSQLAATVVVGVVGLLCLAVGIAGSSVILGILGAVLALLSGMWCVGDVRRALVARGMQRFPD